MDHYSTVPSYNDGLDGVSEREYLKSFRPRCILGIASILGG